MKTFTRRVALAALACALPLLFAAQYAGAQLFGNFPQVGGAAYDSGQGVMVPAGPVALTGNETVPADTNLSQGRQPQTVKVPIQLLGAGPTTFVDGAANGGTSTATANTRRLLLVPAGTIAGYTVVFPTAAQMGNYDNALFGVCSTQTVSALTTTPGAGTTILAAIDPSIITLSITTAYCYEFVYRKSNTTWYRVQ